ncbi:putative L-gulonolactone oxidase 4 [Orchesella cincta]|uniref:Putative L-gulonolactone oxidase 4 n=1 Tax=Orchesella cincta TaxID=48709 RepID=A0A1D2MZD1_ORCCI|nr:putative L-gulonolactone oxidase 4 [Orchesella cincta]
MEKVFTSTLLYCTLVFILFHNAPSNCLEYTPPSEKSENSSNATTIELHEGIEFAFEPYKTWGQGIELDSLLLVAYPKSSEEVVELVNWARKNGRNVRPRGFKHSFPPLTVTKDTDPSKVVLVDMVRHITNLEMTTIPAEDTVTNETLRAVKAETGASWQDLMTFLETNNAGLVHSIIIGDATIGGVLAIGAHGAAVPAKGEFLKPGFSFGSLSNLIAAFKAVVWDPETKTYVLKSFSRSDPDSRVFLAHVGRAFLTEVTLIVGENYSLRCKSIVDIPAEELFADPDKNPNATRTFASFLDETGRADVQWYQFTKNPWLKVWSVEPSKPSSCVEVNGPYNYQFPVNINEPTKTVPELGEIAYENVLKGLASKNASDVWGASKNIMLYSNGSSQPIVYGGVVVLTSREKIQKVLSTVVNFYKSLNDEYAAKSEYPIDYYIKFRVTGIDNANDTLIKDAVNTVLSPLSPPKEYPDFNVAFWMNTFTHRNNKLGNQFMKRFEEFYYDTFNGEPGLARPEWSKSWAYTDEGPFTNTNMLEKIIPARFGSDWEWAVSVLNKYDPERVFSNSFLDNSLHL